MDAKEVMDLFDSYWYEMKIFGKQAAECHPPTTEDEDPPGFLVFPKAEPLYVPKVLARSKSEKLNSKVCPMDSSPNSVLAQPKLKTIYSELEAEDESEARRENKVSKSKSLTELEFEELKGFMDLGFVFSEEDKDSRLVSIIPGLQRLGKTKEEPETPTRIRGESPVRPYLSEAWADSDKKKTESPLMNWRIPALSNEIDMKDNLRWWAHTVASTVR